jgi:tripartite-type tricarboxylate transporter receptor subunit TctC
VSSYRKFAAFTLAAWACLQALPAIADEWPSKPIRWVVPFPPGGGVDATARALGEKAGKVLGQPFIIDNRPGAGGNIGASLVAKSPADGYTLMITSIGMVANKSLYPRLDYDPVKDFAPVTLLVVVPNVLVTNSTQPNIKTVGDVIASAKSQPGKLTYASAGSGSSIHLAGAMFMSQANIKMLHVPYKGSAPAVTDLIGGQVNYMFDSITSAKPHIDSGKIRALAVTTAKRSSVLPNLPTIAEAGLPGYEVSPWFAVFVPAGTPKSVINKLSIVLTEAMKDPDVQKTLQTIGAERVGSTPEELEAHLKIERSRWEKLITDNKLSAE